MIPIYKPCIVKYKKSAHQCIDDEFISNHGKYVALATDKLASSIGARYCILMNNGTSATHCTIKAIKYKYPNVNKIYVPNYVFAAVWNCVLKEYSIDNVEVMKTNPTTYNIDTSEEYISSLDTNSAMIVVHNLGKIVNVPRLQRIRPDIVFVEDNCEGMFGYYENMFSGTNAFCSSCSFYGNKTLTTGEGGAFFTNDESVYNYIKQYYSHGMGTERYVHDVEGTNYRMTNIQAALLYEQLLDVKTILDIKTKIFTNYYMLLDEIMDGLYIPIKSEENTTEACWIFSVIIPNTEYKDIEEYLRSRSIEIRPTFYDIHRHRYLMHTIKHQSVHVNTAVMLPSYPELTYDEQRYIVTCLRESIKK